MPDQWTRKTRERGAYTTVAQTEDATTELTAHGAALDREDWDTSDKHALDDASKPTPEDLLLLPRVADKLPYGAFLVAIVELCERFAYYGLSGPFQNYMANSYHDANGLPGALGLDQARATALSNMFQSWCYVTPIAGAVVSDSFLGKYATIKWFSLVYMAGIVILFFTSLPWCIESGAALPGLLVAMVVIGLGTGGIKSNVSPLIAEQVRSTEPFVETRRDGKRVIVDPEVTVQRIYMIYYLCINIGSVSAIATTMMELHVGFWSAYLLPLIMFCVGFAVLVWGKDRYVIKPPQGGVIGSCFRALWIAARNGFDLDKARPSFQQGRKQAITWDDKFIDELKTAMVACKVFLFFPVYWVTFSQMMNNFISQGTCTCSLHLGVANHSLSRPNATPRPPQRHPAQHRPNNAHPLNPSPRPPHLPLHPHAPTPRLHPDDAHHPGLPRRSPRHAVRGRPPDSHLPHATLLRAPVEMRGWQARRGKVRAEPDPRRMAGAGVHSDRAERGAGEHHGPGARVRKGAREHEEFHHELVPADQRGRQCVGHADCAAGQGSLPAVAVLWACNRRCGDGVCVPSHV
jgi:MFS family permease